MMYIFIVKFLAHGDIKKFALHCKLILDLVQVAARKLATMTMLHQNT